MSALNLLVFLVLSFPGQGTAASPPVTLAPKPTPDFAKAWEDASGLISDRFYARVSRKDEIAKLFEKYGPLAKSAKGEAEFSATVNRMIDDFKDSHFDFFTKADQGYYAMERFLTANPTPMPNIGAWFRREKDRWLVRMVLEGTAAREADLRKGDAVLSVNGAPFEPVASFKGIVGVKAKLRVLRAGKEFEKEVEVSETSAMELFLRATRDSVQVLERDGKKFGYIHLWTMSNDDFRNAVSNAVYGRCRDTDGFILDLRDGFGGRPEGFADPFFRPESKLEWKFGEQGPVQRQLFGYQRPLVVIINEGSRSAKEVLSHILQRSKRATLVGSTTAGHVLGTSPMRVSDWAILEIPMVEVIADGVRLEGVGVKPDIPVSPEFDDAGKDLYLEKTLEVLAAQVRNAAT